MICRHGLVSGKVQGVGFRYFVHAVANREKLTGFVRNLPDGSVEVVLCGDMATVERVQELISEGPAGARVMKSVWNPDPVEGFVGFDIL